MDQAIHLGGEDRKESTRRSFHLKSPRFSQVKQGKGGLSRGSFSFDLTRAK